MNFKILLCVTAMVLVGYLALFQIIENWRGMKAPPRPAAAPPSFQTKVIRYQDAKGNDVERESQFKISTKLVDEETMKKLPPPPKAIPVEE